MNISVRHIRLNIICIQFTPIINSIVLFWPPLHMVMSQPLYVDHCICWIVPTLYYVNLCELTPCLCWLPAQIIGNLSDSFISDFNASLKHVQPPLSVSSLTYKQCPWGGKCACTPICACTNPYKMIKIATCNHQTDCLWAVSVIWWSADWEKKLISHMTLNVLTETRC